jgi:DUF971 family protein
MQPPSHIDLKKDRGLTIGWPDGSTSFYPIAHLRRWSPSADSRELRAEQERNPLTVIPGGRSSGPLVALDAELVGNYALRLHFSDGHDAGIYTWEYLWSIDPTRMAEHGSAQSPDARSREPD